MNDMKFTTAGNFMLDQTTKKYPQKFTDAELQKIMEQGMIYMCACPAQVAESIRHIRALHLYQSSCLEDPCNDKFVHTTIAATAEIVHAQLESCMNEILLLEKWDPITLEMPEGLRKRQIAEIDK